MAIDPYWLEPFIKTPFLKGALFENKAPLRRPKWDLVRAQSAILNVYHYDYHFHSHNSTA